MKQSILVVDSHPVYGQKTVAFLQGLAFSNVRLATTGRRAIEEAQFLAPDMVILSAVLSDLDSQWVCREMMRICGGGLPIIVQVGLFVEMNTEQQFMAAGASAVIERKEKDLAPLQEVIERFLQKTI